MPDYLPISDHGLIGDLRTCALVGKDATIDWFCAPRFDSPSIFGSLLDPDQGGSWALHADDDVHTTHQFYYPDSCILVTRINTAHGSAEIHDYMPLLRAHDAEHRQRLVRRVFVVRGRITLDSRLTARPDYGRAGARISEHDHGLLIEGDGVRLGLAASVDLQVDDGTVSARVELGEGEQALFVLEVLDADAARADVTVDPVDTGATDALLDATATFWRTWLAQSSYRGRWREMVNRSAMTLKLLTHEPSGAIIAAPTTSLPEKLGGELNWDYRYVWIRDAAFSLYGLLRLGFTDEAAAFMDWLTQRLGDAGDVGSPARTDADGDDLGPLRVLYDIDGRVPDQEATLDHLRGYRDSTPVRVGNAAVGQLQLDSYGELIDSVYLFDKYGDGINHAAWRDLTSALEWLLENWDRADAGMWEPRGEPQANTTSRLMCWVAVERMMRTARSRGLPGDLSRWGEVRDAIYERIMTEHWNEDLGAFTRTAGGDTLDAGVLLMPLTKFVAPTEPRFVSTLEAVEERLVSDSLVFRYDAEASDGSTSEGTFSLCSFWYVEALTRVGRLDDARLALEKMFTYANHLGLYSEEIGLDGAQLGNFPQAFTHLSLISAATNLDRDLDAHRYP